MVINVVFDQAFDLCDICTPSPQGVFEGCDEGRGVGEWRDSFFGLGVSLGIHNPTLIFQGLGELLTGFARSRPLVTSTFLDSCGRFLPTLITLKHLISTAAQVPFLLNSRIY